MRSVQERINKFRYNSPALSFKSIKNNHINSSKSSSPLLESKINYSKTGEKTAVSTSMNNSKSIFTKSSPQDFFNIDEKIIYKYINQFSKTATMPINLGKTDYRNIKKIELLKEYDKGVKNFTNIEKIFPELKKKEIKNEEDSKKKAEDVKEIKIQIKEEELNLKTLTEEDEKNEINFKHINKPAHITHSLTKFKSLNILIGSKASEKIKKKLNSIYNASPKNDTELNLVIYYNPRLKIKRIWIYKNIKKTCLLRLKTNYQMKI
jgi:hypothetical protein